MAHLIDQLTRTGSSPEMTATILSTLVATSPDAGPEEQKQILEKLTEALRERQRIIDQMNQVAGVESSVASSQLSAGASTVDVAVADRTRTMTMPSVQPTNQARLRLSQRSAEEEQLPVSVPQWQANVSAVAVPVATMAPSYVTSQVSGLPSSTAVTASAVSNVSSETMNVTSNSSSSAAAATASNLSVLPMSIQQLLSGQSFENLKSIIANVNKQTSQISSQISERKEMQSAGDSLSTSTAMRDASAAGKTPGVANVHGDVDYRTIMVGHAHSAEIDSFHSNMGDQWTQKTSNVLPVSRLPFQPFSEGTNAQRLSGATGFNSPHHSAGGVHNPTGADLVPRADGPRSEFAPRASRQMPLLPTPTMSSHQQIVERPMIAPKENRNASRPVSDSPQTSDIPQLKPPPLPPALSLSATMSTSCDIMPPMRPPLLPPPPIPNLFNVAPAAIPQRPVTDDTLRMGFVAFRPRSDGMYVESGSRMPLLGDQNRMPDSSTRMAPGVSAASLTRHKDVPDNSLVASPSPMPDISLPARGMPPSSQAAQPDTSATRVPNIVTAKHQTGSGERKTLLPTPDTGSGYKKSDLQGRGKDLIGQRVERGRQSPSNRDSLRRQSDRSSDSKESSKRYFDKLRDDNKESGRRKSSYSPEDRERNRRPGDRSSDREVASRPEDRNASQKDLTRRSTEGTASSRQPSNRHQNRSDGSTRGGVLEFSNQPAEMTWEHPMQPNSAQSKMAGAAISDLDEKQDENSARPNDGSRKQSSAGVVALTEQQDGSDMDHAIVVDAHHDGTVAKVTPAVDQNVPKTDENRLHSLEKQDSAGAAQMASGDAPDVIEVLHSDSEKVDDTAVSLRRRSRDSRFKSSSQRRSSRSRSSGRHGSKQHDRRRERSRSRSPRRERSPERGTRCRLSDSSTRDRGKSGDVPSSRSRERSRRSPFRGRRSSPGWKQGQGLRKNDGHRSPPGEYQRSVPSAEPAEGSNRDPSLVPSLVEMGFHGQTDPQPPRRQLLPAPHAGGPHSRPAVSDEPEPDRNQWRCAPEPQPTRELSRTTIDYGHGSIDLVSNRPVIEEYRQSASDRQPIGKQNSAPRLGETEGSRENLNRYFGSPERDGRFHPETNTPTDQPRIDDEERIRRLQCELGMLSNDWRRDRPWQSDRDHGRQIQGGPGRLDERDRGRQLQPETGSQLDNRLHRQFRPDACDKERRLHPESGMRQEVDAHNRDARYQPESLKLDNNAAFLPSSEYSLDKDASKGEQQLLGFTREFVNIPPVKQASNDRFRSAVDRLDERRPFEGSAGNPANTPGPRDAIPGVEAVGGPKKALLGDYPGVRKVPQEPSHDSAATSGEAAQRRPTPDQPFELDRNRTGGMKTDNRLSASKAGTPPVTPDNVVIPRGPAPDVERDRPGFRLMAPPRINESPAGVRPQLGPANSIKRPPQQEKHGRAESMELERRPLLESIDEKKGLGSASIRPLMSFVGDGPIRPPENRPALRPVGPLLPGPRSDPPRVPPLMGRAIPPGPRSILATPSPFRMQSQPVPTGILGARPGPIRQRQPRPPVPQHNIPPSMSAPAVRPIQPLMAARPTLKDRPGQLSSQQPGP